MFCPFYNSGGPGFVLFFALHDSLSTYRKTAVLKMVRKTVTAMAMIGTAYVGTGTGMRIGTDFAFIFRHNGSSLCFIYAL